MRNAWERFTGHNILQLIIKTHEYISKFKQDIQQNKKGQGYINTPGYDKGYI